jgi:hypothetical protein
MGAFSSPTASVVKPKTDLVKAGLKHLAASVTTVFFAYDQQMSNQKDNR